jgi:3'(2'), 5'-bisphosphate nucleotidase
VWQQELEVASRLAYAAGAIIMQVYATNFAVSFKGPNDPVTEADRRANDLIVEGLRKEFPQDGIVAEETADRSGALHRGRIWYIDPLDGTRDFIAKNGEFCVMVGLAENGLARIGVVYSPVEKLLFGGIADETAWSEHNGAREPLSVSSLSNPQDLRLVVSRSHRHPIIDSVRAHLGLLHEMSFGSVGLKIGLIARQMADVYIEPSSLSSAWDACGPEAILRGAGGRFTDMLGNSLRYGGENLRNQKGLVASNSVCHDRVIAVLRPLAQDAKLL